ncbi:bifunctional adenosylcobinamide kinase/adenosylcobinamide-phosphate guanylyltransferase [Paraburkholderia sp. BCC1886]|uniref:bifunctional adenosylcobinamide kinase/adenosylcobinamide-phosphate guanylyltransferase n=1 Tax=Paraburkholderia sp. BCC1886 TaxID=2562670 RepID=UPI001183F20E|nr:bifunctional adenosylcobinamide kinase/adenosylcobinamide-phosphate guanylyltransferase [Paraburkholderia sp. BCC1886]
MTFRDLTFVLGGARSGKSLYAEQLANRSGLPVTYIATARVTEDAEFAERIALHRERRPAHWQLHEAGVELADVIAQLDAPGHCLLIDCLTLWLANLLCPAGGEALPLGRYRACHIALETALGNARGKIIVVSNEIGLGVVPLGAATRQYVDELGRLNQRIAALSTAATMMVAGLPLALKIPDHAIHAIHPTQPAQAAGPTDAGRP